MHPLLKIAPIQHPLHVPIDDPYPHRHPHRLPVNLSPQPRCRIPPQRIPECPVQHLNYGQPGILLSCWHVVGRPMPVYHAAEEFLVEREDVGAEGFGAGFVAVDYTCEDPGVFFYEDVLAREIWVRENGG